MMGTGADFIAEEQHTWAGLKLSEELAVRLTLRACLLRKLQSALLSSGASRDELCDRLGLSVFELNDIFNGRTGELSLECVASCLLKLDYDLILDVRPAPFGHKGCLVDADLDASGV